MSQQPAAVTLKRTGVVVEVQGAVRLLLDTPSGHTLAVTPTTVACHPLQGGPPQIVSIGEGPVVAAGAVSLDGRYLAVQRSPTHIQVVHRLQPGLFVQAPQKGRLLGFCWSSSPQVDLVMITQQGAEMYKMQGDQQGLRLAAKHAHPVAWWTYSHPARMLLLGTGDLGNWLQAELQAYQLSTEGLLKLPPFQVSPASTKGSPSPAAAGKLGPGDVHTVILYGGIYAVYLDRKACRLHLYRFFRDSVELQASYDTPGSSMKLLVLDNLLFAHHPSTGRTGIMDVRGSQSQLMGGVHHLQVPGGEELPPASQRRGWQYKLPNTMLDLGSGELWELQLDPIAVVSHSVPAPAAIAFLLRRSPQCSQDCDIPAAVLDLLRTTLMHSEPLEDVRAALDAATAGLSATPGSKAPESASSSGPPSPAISPPLELQDVVDLVAELWTSAGLPGRYARAVLAELIAAAQAHGLPSPPAAHVLDLQIAAQLGLGCQVAGNVALQPHASRELAVAMQAAGSKVPGAASYAARMLSSCKAHDEAVLALLAQGQVIPAVHHAHRHLVGDVELSRYVSAAEQSGQPLLQHAVQLEAHQPRGLMSGRASGASPGISALPPSRASSMLPVSEGPQVLAAS